MSQTLNNDLELSLNQMILEGQALDAFEKYYGEDIVMYDAGQPPREGKATNRVFEQEFFGAIAEFHGAELHGGAVHGDRSYSEWTFDFTLKDGTRITNRQVAAREWRDGKVVSERFFKAG
jgi:ketosteroid isomerase-like protein